MLPGLTHYMFSDGDASLTRAFDYAVIRYVWSPSNGTDLDTRTAIIGVSGTVDGLDVGWNRYSTVGPPATPYLQWGADNTSVGYESVLVNFDRLAQDFPSATTFTIRLRAFWYNVRADGDITVEFATYLGGTMQLSNYNFINLVGGVVQSPLSLLSYTTNVVTNVASNQNGDDVGLLVYDVATRTATAYREGRVVSVTCSISVLSDMTLWNGNRPDTAIAYYDFASNLYWTSGTGMTTARTVYTVQPNSQYITTDLGTIPFTADHTVVIDVEVLVADLDYELLYYRTTDPAATFTDPFQIYRYADPADGVRRANIYDYVNDLYSGALPLGAGRIAYTVTGTHLAVSSMGQTVASATLSSFYSFEDLVITSPMNNPFLRVKKMVVYTARPDSDLPGLSAL